ncbi:DUF411 domain-containing protein [Pseudoalteromonas luteoviolacea]|uniref:Metal-binding protein n=1 Tax=Pseudoalteromonas luteoviolacea S4054 TaxID=1129367 RepID=A0A0F6AAD7_9GAMM|nr:DUF411 domain-containing protein [Pseudoalteromonas luteoviolacea]KKE83113.1 hypothetical protein N479_15690 [Pseudoalteromonas luteoviolacea S4054]KZN73504.1 hypothetical protein N481_12355 [Pseudoalteromonas luteoviolacea S4047-1]
MFKFKFVTYVLFIVAICNFHNAAQAQHNVEQPRLKVYKTPTCGCCIKWLSHLSQQGIAHQVYDLPDLGGVKSQLNIKPRYQSCHTGVSDGGYVFEGHVPAKFIKQFLAAPVKGAIGLSVPAMPLGSPGMEVGQRFHPYQILVLMADGSSQVFTEISTYKEQF